MSNELVTLDQWSDMKGYGVTIPTAGTPRVHVCQDKSPEVKKTKVAQIGDLVIRPTGTNLGKTFDAVVLSTDRRYFRWGSKKNGDPEAVWNKVLWQGEPNELTADQAKETLWGPASPATGGKGTPPKASDTVRFIVLPVSGEGDAMILDPHGTGAVVVTMDRTSLKAGDTLASTLKGLKASNGEQVPSFAAVVRFTTVSDPTKNDVQVWTPSVVGRTSRAKHGAALKQAADIANSLWDSMGGGHGDEETTVPPTTGASAKPVDEDLPF